MILDNIREAIKKELGFELALEFVRDYADVTINPSELMRASGGEVDDFVAKLRGGIDSALGEMVEKIEYKNGFFNIFLSDQVIVGELSEMLDDPGLYMASSDNVEKTIVFDYSSPNIAKPFSVGHLRSTIIGQANLNCHKAIGYKTVGVNHIGDWGTQFGKLIVAIKKWGNEKEIDSNPIEKLNQLYIRFHKEQEKNPELGDEARLWFKKMESGDKEAKRLWQKCVSWSLKEFDDIYKRLEISIDDIKGESFYEDKIQSVIDELKDKNLLVKSKGAYIVELENLPPALIQKSDGATLYLTRDLAALKYRIEKYKPDKIIYHVGNDQALHFKQLEIVASKLGWLNNTSIFFAGHGLLRLPEGKMSTRKGRTVPLKELIEEAEKRSIGIINKKNPELNNKNEVAHKLGLAAIKYSDLSQNRKSDIVFSFDRAVTMEGNSGPYLLYTYARINSLINNFEKMFPGEKYVVKINENNKDIGKMIIEIPSVLCVASSCSSPNIVCEYAHKLANSFNSYYERERVVSNNKTSSQERVFIAYVMREVLGSLLDIIGLNRLEEI